MGSIDWSGPKNKASVRVTLSCGHAIRTNTEPMRKGARYACRQNLGCGYNLLWTSWEDRVSNRTGVNSGV